MIVLPFEGGGELIYLVAVAGNIDGLSLGCRNPSCRTSVCAYRGCRRGRAIRTGRLRRFLCGKIVGSRIKTMSRWPGVRAVVLMRAVDRVASADLGGR